jgi:hypothetical protein
MEVLAVFLFIGGIVGYLIGAGVESSDAEKRIEIALLQKDLDLARSGHLSCGKEAEK